MVGHARSGVLDVVEHGGPASGARRRSRMVEAAARLVADPALRIAMSAHNRECAPRHSWPYALARTGELYALARLRAGSTTAGARAGVSP
ncbi:MAG: hypothetical protein R2731_11160 [Nocardioides sp.]